MFDSAGSSEPAAHRVLLTFVADTAEHMKYVRWLASNLTRHGAAVRRQDQVVSPRWHLVDGLMAVLQQAQTVVVVLSPRYAQCVDERTASADVHVNCARYIYRQLQSEYLANACVHRRARCVVFPFHDDRASTPGGIFNNTLHFAWPQQQQQFFEVIFEAMPADSHGNTNMNTM